MQSLKALGILYIMAIASSEVLSVALLSILGSSLPYDELLPAKLPQTETS